MQIKVIMSPDVEVINANATLRSAAERMRELDTGILPVSGDDRMQGILTDRDIVVWGLARGLDPDTARVGECMSEEVVFCNEEDDIRSAADKMERFQVRRLLVCDREGQIVGIVSLGDIATELQDHRLTGEVLERISEPPHARAHH